MSPLFWLLIGGRCCPSEGYCWWVQGSYGQRTGWGQKGGPPICDVQGPHWQNWQGMLLASLSCFRHWQILKLNCSRSLARMDIRKTRRCWRMSLTLPGPLPVGMSPPFIRYRRTSLRRRMLDALVIIQTIVAFELAFVSLCFRCHVFTRTCFVRRNHFGTKEIIFFLFSFYTLLQFYTLHAIVLNLNNSYLLTHADLGGCWCWFLLISVLSPLSKIKDPCNCWQSCIPVVAPEGWSTRCSDYSLSSNQETCAF